jgi:hypothetical protein
MLHGGEIHVARRLATGAPDLKPGKAAVDGLVDGRRRVDRLAVRPHPLIPTFAQQSIGLLQHALGLGPHLHRLRCQDTGPITVDMADGEVSKQRFTERLWSQEVTASEIPGTKLRVNTIVLALVLLTVIAVDGFVLWLRLRRARQPKQATLAT